MTGYLFNVYSYTLLILISAVLVQSERSTLYLQDAENVIPSQANIQHVQKHNLQSENATNTEHLKKRIKRDLGRNREPDVTVFSLHDNHTSAFISWAGTTESMVVLTTSPGTAHPSRLYVSTDRGRSFIQKAGPGSSRPLSTQNGTAVNIDKMYHSPQANDYTTSAKHYVFTDKAHKVLVTTRDLVSYTVRQLYFTPSSVDFHPTNDDILVADDEEHLYVSLNYGFSWTTLATNVKSYYWGPGGDTIYASVRVGIIFGGSNYDVKNLSLSGSFYASTLTTQAVDFILKDNYMFVTKKTNIWGSFSSHNHLNLFVSKDNGEFQKADIPNTFGSKLEFLIFDVERDRVMICATHHSNSTHLYVSDVTGLQYTLSLPNVVYYSDLVITSSWMSYLFKKPFADIHKVGGLRGIFIASQWTNNATNISILDRPQATRITYDKGGIWTHLVAPFRDAQSQHTWCSWYSGCTLHLIGKFQMGITYVPTEPILSSANAPGVIMGEGVLGSRIKSNNISLYLSTDAGFTWKEVQKGDQLFNMGDHGNFIVETASRRATDEIMYSYDEGESWRWTYLNSSVIVYGILTKPGSKTGQFSLWGSYSSSSHSWEVIQVNLTSMYYNTTSQRMDYCHYNDYKLWTPGVNVTGKEICLLGETDQIERKIPNHFCLNGETYVRDTYNKTCKCERIDYECDYGYIRDDEKYSIWNTNPTWYDTENNTCTKFNATQTHGVPSNCPFGSTYNVSKGYRKIAGDVCSGGHDHLYDPIVRYCPQDERRQYILYAAGRHIYRYMLEDRTTESVRMYASSSEIIALDYDYNNDTLYWADASEDAIKYANMNSTWQPAQTLLQGNAGKVECITFDWESGNLYFVDASTPKIEVVAIRRGFRRTVVHNNMTDMNVPGIPNYRILELPRALDIAPQHGLMFWTDWSLNHPRVMRSSMTGYNISVLVDTSNVLGFPNGLAVDNDQEKVYIIDGQTSKILRTDYFGSIVTAILTNSYYVNQPYGFAVYRDRLFWSDWSDKKIKTVYKKDGNGYYYVVENYNSRINAIKAIHYDGQYITNKTGCGGAGNGGCSNICVPHVTNTTTGTHQNRLCLCPDDTRPSKVTNMGNERECNCSDASLTWNITTGDCMPASGNHCNVSSQYACARGNCIPIRWRCDGDNDCHDLSDEMNCEHKDCTNEQFLCKNTQRCIRNSWICDGDNDCGDHSDEQHCPAPNCTTSQFQCANGRCIPGSYKCDGMVDCYGGDDSDERNCTHGSTPAPCTGPQFHCVSTQYSLYCLPPNWKCDGDFDCDDGSDEVNCTKVTCDMYTEFTCGTNVTRTCVPAGYRCDGDNDCGDFSDERGCTTYNTTTPYSTQSSCDVRCNNGMCYSYWILCDGYPQCPDGSDEIGCRGWNVTTVPTSTTQSCEMYCSCSGCVGNCLPSNWRCDGYSDCADGSDEVDCSGCPTNHIPCAWDANVCIMPYQQCDGHNDCRYAEDEIYCTNHTVSTTQRPTGCPSYQYQCAGYQSICIYNNQTCNGLWNCPSGDDELHCGFSAPVNLTAVFPINSRNVTVIWVADVKNSSSAHYLVQYKHVFDIYDESRYQPHAFMNFSVVNTTQVIISGLTPASNYKVRVKLNSPSAAFSKPLKLSTAEDVPGPINNLHVTQLATSWLIQFNYPELPNGRLTQYIIRVRQGGQTILERHLAVSAEDNRNRAPVAVEYRLHTLDQMFYIPLNFSVAAWTEAGVGKFTYITHCVDLPEPNVTASAITETSVVMTWHPENKSLSYVRGDKYLQYHYTDLDGHVVERNISADADHPQFAVSGLAPGHKYGFVIHYKVNHYDCRSSSKLISFKTKGKAGSRVRNVKVVNGTVNATSASLIWTPIQGTKLYKVVLAHLEEDFRIGKYNLELTSTLPNIVLTKLHSCQIYVYAVRTENPVGPLSIEEQFQTKHDPTAAPRNIMVTVTDNLKQYKDLSWMSKQIDKINVTISWNDPCADTHTLKVNYTVTINQLNSTGGPPMHYTAQAESYSIQLERGGDYQIIVQNTNKRAKRAVETQLVAAYPMPHVVTEQIDQDYKGVGGTVKFSLMDTRTPVRCRIKVETRKIVGTDGFITQSDTIRTVKDFNVNLTVTDASYKISIQYVRYNYAKSPFFSEPYVYQAVKFGASAAIPSPAPSKSKTGMYIGISVSVVVILILAVVLGVYCFKHRRLQESFAQFTMSRYNSRTDSTTLGGDDDSPMIQGFADDEPLVVA